MSIVIEGLELPEDKTVQIIIENKRFGWNMKKGKRRT